MKKSPHNFALHKQKPAYLSVILVTLETSMKRASKSRVFARLRMSNENKKSDSKVVVARLYHASDHQFKKGEEFKEPEKEGEYGKALCFF